ncbi:MAG TPA: hypothetical protein VF177_22615 [Anaerolineae bacterium]
MRSVFKWMGFLIGGLAGLIVVVLAAVYFITESRLNETYDVQVETPEQAASR